MTWLREGDTALGPTSELTDAIAVVEAFTPADDDQSAARRQILDLITTHDESLHRTCMTGHLTGSAVVVDRGVTRTLVLFHRKLQKWLQPGGHVDGDANLAAGALREATEETGIAGLEVWSEPVDLDVHVVEPPSEAAHLHLDVRYVVRAPDGAIEQGNHESEQLLWVALDELDLVELDASALRLIEHGSATARRYG
ncbi:MAG: NUDIX hydrolase [Actinomycetota bacterium]